jgi:hypothetical protein
VPAGATDALVPFPPAIANPLAADLGDSVRLLGLDAPKQAHPGEPITLAWTFFARGGAIAPGWKLFVHLDGPNKTFVNADHAPVRPFEWWRAGQFIHYTTQVTIPRGSPSGHYTIKVGMFRGNERAHVTPDAGGDAVLAATFEVAP